MRRQVFCRRRLLMQMASATMLWMATLLLFLLASSCTTQAFQQPLSSKPALLINTKYYRYQPRHYFLSKDPGPASTVAVAAHSSPLFSRVGNHDDKDEAHHEEETKTPNRQGQPGRVRRWWRRFQRRVVLPVVAAVATLGGISSSGNSNRFGRSLQTQPAHASAPVMAMPKAEGRDPASDALSEAERRQQRQTQQDLKEMAQQARKIEASKGEAARIQFEKDYKARQEQAAARKAQGLLDLKLSLLKQGIDPSTDVEGKRQVVLYEKGVDLGQVAGTPFYLEQQLALKTPKRTVGFQKATHRQVIACMVQDMLNRQAAGVADAADPVEYFASHQDKTLALMDMPTARAQALLEQYQANLEQYGQITAPKEGEVSIKDQMATAAAAAVKSPEATKAAKLEAKRLKAEQRAAEKAERQRLKAEAAAKRKEEAARKKEQAAAAKKEAAAAKKAAAAAAAAAAAGAAGAAAAAGSAGSAAVEQAATAVMEQANAATVVEQQEQQSVASSPGEDGSDGGVDGAAAAAVAAVEGSSSSATAVSEKKKVDIPIVPAAAVVVAAGGGGVAFKIMRDKAAADEEERQRQFRLLMGEADGTGGAAPALEEIGTTDTDSSSSSPTTPSTSSTPPAAPAATPASASSTAPAGKKRRMGKKMFGRKKNDRETDLMALVADNAKAPALAQLLAKLLTFGAPGRFPTVLALPGGMPLETFDLDAAKTLLSQAREEAGLELQESAEVFADVVNCMLIDIVDLASSSLKEKDESITVKSINIVVDFMNHAASLYDSVASGIVIKPVTYGGALGKSKLEQMYSTYAVSGMMSMFGGSAEGGGGEDGTTDGAAAPPVSDDFDSRVSLLQDVFQISEKKAEGLMMKAVQKNMMQMMKDGKGMEGMEQMLGGAGGMEGLAGGMPGLGADGEAPDPEQLKEMLKSLKQMKDSGAIPPEEFNEVKKQFKQAFGSSLEDVVKDANAEGDLSGTDKELLDLMKSIMD